MKDLSKPEKMIGYMTRNKDTYCISCAVTYLWPNDDVKYTAAFLGDKDIGERCNVCGKRIQNNAS